MEKLRVRAKKWGSSVGVVIPTEVARRNHIQPGTEFVIGVELTQVRARDLAGILKGLVREIDWAEADRELASGWNE